MASIYDGGVGFGPVGRPGNYSFETVTLPSGASYVWKPNERRWDLTNQSALTGDDGITKISTINNYVIRISSNVTGATIFNNGEKTTSTTPSTLNVIKANFIGSSIRYEVKKDGYKSNIYYVVKMVSNQGLQPRGYLFQVNNSILGLSKNKLIVEKYVDGSLQQSYDVSTSFVDLRFDLEKEEVKPKITTLPLTVNVSGLSEGVLLRSNTGEELEVGKGKNDFVRVKGESFSVQSANTSIYRISSIEVKEGGNRLFSRNKGESIKAKNSESAKTKFTLNTPTTINIRVERPEKITPRPPLPPPQNPTPIGSPTPAPQPVIRLTPSPEEGDPRIYRIDNKSKLHNINSKTGLPLAFRKNADVEAVTVFVGDETFEYDNLGDSEVAGIVIPARAFKNIGRYDIKMIPFSLDELEETRREISRRGVTREVVTEETKYVEVRVPKPVPRPVPKPIPRPIPPKEEIIIKPKPPKPKPPKPPKPKPPIPLRRIDEPGYRALDNLGRPVGFTDSVSSGGGAGVTFVSLEEYDSLGASGRVNFGNPNRNFVLDGRIRDRVGREL